jgi:hypothetical protein
VTTKYSMFYFAKMFNRENAPWYTSKF